MTSCDGNICRVTGHLCGHRSPVNSSHKGQWRGALLFHLICVWINVWVNNREAGDLRRYRAHYDISVMRYSPRQCGLETPYGGIDPGQDWLRYWFCSWWHQAITWANVDLFYGFNVLFLITMLFSSLTILSKWVWKPSELSSTQKTWPIIKPTIVSWISLKCLWNPLVREKTFIFLSITASVSLAMHGRFLFTRKYNCYQCCPILPERKQTTFWQDNGLSLWTVFIQRMLRKSVTCKLKYTVLHTKLFFW